MSDVNEIINFDNGLYKSGATTPTQIWNNGVFMNLLSQFINDLFGSFFVVYFRLSIEN